MTLEDFIYHEFCAHQFHVFVFQHKVSGWLIALKFVGITCFVCLFIWFIHLQVFVNSFCSIKHLWSQVIVPLIRIWTVIFWSLWQNYSLFFLKCNRVSLVYFLKVGCHLPFLSMNFTPFSLLEYFYMQPKVLFEWEDPKIFNKTPKLHTFLTQQLFWNKHIISH